MLYNMHIIYSESQHATSSDDTDEQFILEFSPSVYGRTKVKSSVKGLLVFIN